MSDNKPKAPQFADDDWRSQVELHPDEDGYPRWDESGEGIWFKPNPETQCGNCGNKLEPDDRYCRMCGAKRGEGKYEPCLETLDALYIIQPDGENPLPALHSCTKCGYCWTVCQRNDRQKYCPMCGGLAPIDDWYPFIL